MKPEILAPAKKLTGAVKFKPRCVGPCLQLKWDPRRRCYVCVNCGAPDR